ncbi:hypothetical protein ACHAXT_008316 [Thalassiosira profunda]
MAADERAAPQDGGAFMTGRSLMVGFSTTEEPANDRSDRTGGNRSDMDRSASMLNISQISREQAQAAARASRFRSDAETLSHAVADAGMNAFGCVAVEVWVMKENGTKFTRPEGGHWMKPAFAQSLPSEILIEKAWELDRHADDCPPGAGLAGTLAEEGGLDNRNVHWAQIKRILNDPFIQKESGRRMERFYELGIGLVAAVPFQFQDDCRGIVLFYSRSTANVKTLQSPSNERFLVAASDVIGSNYAVRKARQESAAFRRGMFQEGIRKARKELLNDKRSLVSYVKDKEAMDKLRKEKAAQDAEGGDMLDLVRVDRCAVNLAKKAYRIGRNFLRRLNNSRRKWRGAKLHGPPRQSWTDSLAVFVGVFLTMLILLKVDKVAAQADSKFDFDPGWYSSTLCIIYALTPAPVGQPRQIFLAHIWNMLVGLACREIPSYYNDFMDWSGAPPDAERGLPKIWVLALACALGVSGQAKLGILHPPATGLSMTFTSKPQWTWTTFVSVMLADGLLTVMAMLLVNLSEKKQWPLYWLGFSWEGSGGTMGIARKTARSVRRGVRSGVRSVGDSIPIELKKKEDDVDV